MAAAARGGTHPNSPYLETLNVEGLARGFNAALVREMRRSASVMRRMDMEELPRYLDGTFESRIEEGRGAAGTRRSA